MIQKYKIKQVKSLGHTNIIYCSLDPACSYYNKTVQIILSLISRKDTLPVEDWEELKKQQKRSGRMNRIKNLDEFVENPTL